MKPFSTKSLAQNDTQIMKMNRLEESQPKRSMLLRSFLLYFAVVLATLYGFVADTRMINGSISERISVKKVKEEMVVP